MFCKIIKGIALVAISVSAISLHAEETSANEIAKGSGKYRKYRDTNNEERKPGADCFVQKKMDDQWGLKMPSAYGCNSNNGLLVTLDYLLMRGYNENLVYAFAKRANMIAGSLSNLVVEGKMVTPKRIWQPGFRLGFGWDTWFDHWDVYTDWTYYHNKSVTNRAMPNDVELIGNTNVTDGFIPYWAAPRTTAAGATVNDEVYFQNMQGVWQLNYNMLNLELGRSLYLTKALAIRPHFGLQNGWIHQKVAALYERSFNGAIEVHNGELTRSNNNFWGIGLRSGFDTDWQLGGGWSVIGKVAGSLLTGRTRARTVQSSKRPGDDFLRSANVTYKARQVAPGVQAALGLNWGTCLDCKTMYLGFSALWETMYWWGQFDFIRPNKYTDGGASAFSQAYQPDYPMANKGLKIEGFTLKGRLDF